MRHNEGKHLLRIHKTRVRFNYNVKGFKFNTVWGEQTCPLPHLNKNDSLSSQNLYYTKFVLVHKLNELVLIMTKNHLFFTLEMFSQK